MRNVFIRFKTNRNKDSQMFLELIHELLCSIHGNIMCHSQHISKQCHTVFRIYAVVHFPSHKNTLNNFDNFWHVKLTAHTPTIRNVIFFTLFARWRHESGVFSPLLHPLLPLSAAILVNRNFYIKPTKVHY